MTWSWPVGAIIQHTVEQKFISYLFCKRALHMVNWYNHISIHCASPHTCPRCCRCCHNCCNGLGILAGLQTWLLLSPPGPVSVHSSVRSVCIPGSLSVLMMFLLKGNTHTHIHKSMRYHGVQFFLSLITALVTTGYCSVMLWWTFPLKLTVRIRNLKNLGKI